MKTQENYEKICKLLAYKEKSHFIKILKGGAISFTLGNPNEIFELAKRVDKAGLKMAAKLRKHYGKNRF